ncbi:MAG: TetR/AcrR family transcriptional regulator [Bryobacteraceae bacterium]
MQTTPAVPAEKGTGRSPVRTALRARKASHDASGRSRNKHQLRTEETRRKLLNAAEKVFSKVGFEAARLEDIAKEAGHTRGAFYAHFSKKEDLFFALLEQKAYQHFRTIEAMTDEYPDRKERIRKFRDYYSNLAANRNWSMLMLEFKLFAARHPKLRDKLAARHRHIRASFKSGGVSWLEICNLGHKSQAEGSLTRIALEAVLHGVTLESAYDPVVFPKEEAARMLGEIFDLLVSSGAST